MSHKPVYKRGKLLFINIWHYSAYCFGQIIMRIRKLFKFENAHIVRNCSSERCKHSIHGHSYQIELILEATRLDHGQMVYDFGLLSLPSRTLSIALIMLFVFGTKMILSMSQRVRNLAHVGSAYQFHHRQSSFHE